MAKVHEFGDIILEPPKCSQCKNCRWRQQDVVIQGITIEKYNSGLCAKYKNLKPVRIMDDEQICEYREDEGPDGAIISKQELQDLFDALKSCSEKLSDEEKRRRRVFLDAKYIPPRYFAEHSAREINKQIGFDLMDDDIRQTMVIYEAIIEFGGPSVKAKLEEFDWGQHPPIGNKDTRL